MVSRSRNKWQKVKKFASYSGLQTVQILTNDVNVIILCLSYFIDTVLLKQIHKKFMIFAENKELLAFEIINVSPETCFE